MTYVDRPERGSRTPTTEAAYLLTRLQKAFEAFAKNSNAWPVGKDAAKSFETEVFGTLSRCENLDADLELEAFLGSCRNATEEGRDYLESGLFECLWVSAAYCVQAMRNDRVGHTSVAWSQISDAAYWLGTIDAVFPANGMAVDAVKQKARKAANARHAENKAIEADIKRWFLENHEAYLGRLDDAATDAQKQARVSWRTARKYITEANKELRLRSACKE